MLSCHGDDAFLHAVKLESPGEALTRTRDRSVALGSASHPQGPREAQTGGSPLVQCVEDSPAILVASAQNKAGRLDGTFASSRGCCCRSHLLRLIRVS